MSKRLRLVLAVLAVVALAVLLRFVVLRPKPVAVEVARVERGAVEESVTNTRAGTVKARQRAKISPQLGGLVVALPFREGSRVRAGDLLLRLEDSVQRAQHTLALEDVRAVTAKAEEACLAAELARRDWERVAALALDNIASPQAVDTAATNRDRSQAGCRAARAAEKQARAQVALAAASLALTEVRAPFAGVVADISTELGEWITPSPPGVPIPAVIDLLDAASLYVSAPIDEVDAERVRPGQEARLQIDSRPGEHFSGRVVRVAPYVLDLLEQNRTVEIEAELADPAAAAAVLPGTSADVEVILSRRDGVLRVPTSAIAVGGKVLVLEAGRLMEREVGTGLRNWQFTEVISGLAEGEQVVTRRDSPNIKVGARAEARPAP